MNEVLRQSA